MASKRPRVLLVHKAMGELGDRIRIESITKFLLDSAFDVRSVRLPSISFSSNKSNMYELLASLLPLHRIPKYDSTVPLIGYLNSNSTKNYLAHIYETVRFDIILAETSLIGWQLLELAKKSHAPLVVDVHGLAGAEARGRGQKSWPMREALETEVFQNCDQILTVSKRMKEYIVRHYGVTGDKIAVIYNGGYAQESVATFQFPLKVIFAGRLAYWEKVDDYLDLAKKASREDFKFYLAGSGEMRNHLLSRIKKENIRIDYLGYVPRARMLVAMSKMQVGIAPSTKDVARLVAFPIKLLDYMSCGLPVVTPMLGDWGEMITQEDCGIALEEDSAYGYLSALNDLRSEDVWSEKSLHGIEAIQDRYNWDSVLSELKEILLGMLK